MFEKIRDILGCDKNNSGSGDEEEVNKLSEEKIDFLTNVTFDHARYVDSLLKDDNTYFNDRLKKTSLEIATELAKVIHHTENDFENVKPVFDEKSIIQILKEFLSQDFNPPTNSIELQSHLFTLWIYYGVLSRAIKSIPLISKMHIDIAMAKVVNEAKASIVSMSQTGKSQDGALKRKRGKKDKKAERAKPVFKEFYKMDRKQELEGKSFYKIACEIHDSLDKQIRGAPSIDTIKRYLKNDEKIHAILLDKGILSKS